MDLWNPPLLRAVIGYHWDKGSRIQDQAKLWRKGGKEWTRPSKNNQKKKQPSQNTQKWWAQVWIKKENIVALKWKLILKCGACELLFASEKGGLWTKNFQIWGLVNWKFPNSRACELKISKFGGLRAKIWAKIEAVEAKISKLSQKGSCALVNWLFCLKWDPWGLEGHTSPYPFSRPVPPRGYATAWGSPRDQGHFGDAGLEVGEIFLQNRG